MDCPQLEAPVTRFSIYAQLQQHVFLWAVIILMTQTFTNFAYITGFCLANKTPCELFLYKQPNNTIFL